MLTAGICFGKMPLLVSDKHWLLWSNGLIQGSVRPDAISYSDATSCRIQRGGHL